MSLMPYSQEPAPARRSTDLPENAARALAGSFNMRVIAFLLVHMPLAFAMELAWPVATGHAIVTTLLGLRWAWLGNTRRTIYTLAYITGAEVLWRMGEARIFWEYGKYALALVAFVALVGEWRKGGGRLRAIAPALLVLAILPAAVLAVLDMELGAAIDALSFNLSAYAALIMTAFYLWARPVDRQTTANLLLALLAPITGILFLASYSTITQIGVDSFGAVSSWIRSGDFGANQVANMLSLGALAGVILLVILPRARATQAFIALLTIAMIVQGILTYSRGGVYSLILAVLAFGFHLWRAPGARGRFVLMMAVFVALVFGVVYPWLNDISTGSITVRFQDLDTTGRLELAQADLMAFGENTLPGTGVGGSVAYHEYVLGEPVGAHTEYTRLLAEHGLFGILIMVLMAWMLLKRYLGNRPGLARAISAAMSVWLLSVMVHSATRLVAVSFAFALALVAWQLEKETAGAAEAPSPAAGAIVPLERAR
jgi:O-antigen ligase